VSELPTPETGNPSELDHDVGLTVADDGADGVAHANQLKTDLVILDMPWRAPVA